MGRRFRLVTNGDGWTEIVRTKLHNSTTAPISHIRRSGTLNNYSKEIRQKGRSFMHRDSKQSQISYHTKRHGSGKEEYKTKSNLTSLLSYLKPSTNNHHISSKAKGRDYITTPHLFSLLNTSFSEPQLNPSQPEMTRKKIKAPSTTHNTPHNTPNSTANTMGRSYAHMVTPNNNIHLIQHPNRYPHPIWKSYLDDSPWTVTSKPNVQPPLATPEKNPPQQLPLPPKPAHPEWRGRCYNCLNLGHDQNDCTRQERVCARCWKTGHEARACTYVPPAMAPSFDPLAPRGNMGDDLMPKDRPAMTMVFVPEMNQMQQDVSKMQRAIVIDARLRQNHNIHILQSILMATCATPFPFPLSKLNTTQYLLLLPPGIEKEAFLTAHSSHLKDRRYVAFPWSSSVNGTPMLMNFKVWVELKGMPHCSWTVEHLLRVVGSIGIVLDHAHMVGRISLENMRAVVSVLDLSLVPQNTTVWVRGVARIVEVSVYAWIEESIPMVILADTTPSPEFFEKTRYALTAGQSSMVQGGENLSVDFDTLYGVWLTMDDGKKKHKIETVLKHNPMFETRVTRDAKRSDEGKNKGHEAPLAL